MKKCYNITMEKLQFAEIATLNSLKGQTEEMEKRPAQDRHKWTANRFLTRDCSFEMNRINYFIKKTFLNFIFLNKTFFKFKMENYLINKRMIFSQIV